MSKGGAYIINDSQELVKDCEEEVKKIEPEPENGYTSGRKKARSKKGE